MKNFTRSHLLTVCVVAATLGTSVRSASAALELTPSDSRVVSDLTTAGTLNTVDVGAITGEYVVRSRSNIIQNSQQVASFLQFDLTSLTAYQVNAASFSAIFEIDYVSQLNTVNAGLDVAVGRNTSGAWDSTGSNNPLHDWGWADESGGSVTADQLGVLVTEVSTATPPSNNIQIDVTSTVKDWVNGVNSNDGFVLFGLDNVAQGAGFSNASLTVNKTPLVTFAFGANASNSDAMFGANGYANASNFLASGVGSDTLTDTESGNNLIMTVDPSGNTSIASDVGLGDDANASTAWNGGDTIDFTFDQDVILDTVWVNHGDGGGTRTIEVQAILNPGVDQVDLGILSFTGVKNLPLISDNALEFGDVLGGDTVLLAGQVLRLIAPGTTDNGRIAGITVRTIPTPAALPAGLAMLGIAAARRRRR